MSPKKAKIESMLAMASEVREHAYAPYSGFKVGAVVEGSSGRVYAGCNVENVSYGLSICAERVALCRAVTEGENQIATVVIVAGEGKPSRPCGACLQFVAEFSPRQEPTTIVTANTNLEYDIRTIADYLPMPFEL